MLGIGQAEQVLEVKAPWLTGSFASGTADRFPDIDLRGCLMSEEFDYFSSVESALSRRDGWFILKRRRFSGDRPDSEIVIDFPAGLCLDFHAVTPDRLNGPYLDPYPIRILVDKGCDLAQRHASIRREHESRKPAGAETRTSRAATARGRHSYTLSLLEGTRVALAQVLIGRTEAIPLTSSQTMLPKYMPPDAVIEAIPGAIVALAAALRDNTGDLEKGDATGRLARMRSSVEDLMRREELQIDRSEGGDRLPP